MRACGFAGWNTEIADIVAAQFFRDEAAQSKCAVKFTVTSKSYLNKGTRAEFSKDFGDMAGEEAIYRWEFLVPKSHQDIPIWNTQTDTPNWQTLAQFHDQPDPSKGESWKTYPGNSSPLKLGYAYIDFDEPHLQKQLKNPEVRKVFERFDVRSGDSVVALIYDYKPQVVIPIIKGEWVPVELHVRWSRADDGYGIIRIGGEDAQHFKVQGRNMINDMPHYFKLGLYRNPAIQHESSVFVRDFEYQPVAR